MQVAVVVQLFTDAAVKLVGIGREEWKEGNAVLVKRDNGAG